MMKRTRSFDRGAWHRYRRVNESMRIVIAGDGMIGQVDWLRAIAAQPGAREPRLYCGANTCEAAFADAADPATNCLIACGDALDALPGALAGMRMKNAALCTIALVDWARVATVDALLGAGVTAAFAIDAKLSAEQRQDELRLAMSGVRLVDPGLLPVRAAVPAAPPSFPSLSRRQREVVSLIAGGASNKQIARALSLSETTVKSHLTATMRRLGLSSRLHLAIAATRAGASIG
jgi:DNA-binding NarL/FixJ family response regulator